MKAFVQRVKDADVRVSGQAVGTIGAGLLVLLGVARTDTTQTAHLLAQKVAHVRVFSDAEGKMNLSVLSCGGEVLAVPNFTLCADIRKGNRPSFCAACPPERAKELFDAFVYALRQAGIERVQTGVFGADMQVRLVNDGPVTILLDSEIWEKQK